MTEHNKTAFEKIKKLKMLLAIYYILLGCTSVMVFVTVYLKYSGSAAANVISTAAIFLAVTFLIFHLIILSGYLKCPVCGSAFFQRTLYIPDVCKECGEDLTKYK